MARYLISALLPALLLLTGAAPAPAQWPSRPPPREHVRPADNLSGAYVNTSNDGRCEVSRRGRDYVFVNENGTAARFDFVGPDRLEVVSGDWDPETVATVTRDRDGRLMLRFKEPGQDPGYWVKVD
jgi:hypothetical protein